MYVVGDIVDKRRSTFIGKLLDYHYGACALII